MDRQVLMRELREILVRLLVGLAVFLIAVLIYKHSDPYAYPGLEDRILYALAPAGIAVLYLYLSDSDACSRLLRAGGVTGVMRDNRYARVCNDLWQSVPPQVRMVASFCIQYGFIVLLLLVVIRSIAPGTIPEWVDAHLMTAAVLLGVVTFYLNKGKLADIETEARQVKIAEKSMDTEFAERYPRVNRVWGMRRVVRWGYTEGWWYVGILALVTIISLGFMVYGLGNFMTIDEPRWINVRGFAPLTPTFYKECFNATFIDNSYARSVGYWDSYLSGDIKATLNTANPSTTTNFLHLLGYFFQNAKIEHYLFLSRLPFVLHNLLFVWIIYFLVKKLYSRDAALLSSTLIALNPLFIGYSRIVNHDSLIGVYIASFILSYWVALDTSNRKYFVLSGIFYALTHLTAYKGAFLIPLLFIMPVFYYCINCEKISSKFFGKCVSGFMYFIVGSITTSVILLPAVVAYPEFVYNRFLMYPRVIHATLISILLFTLFLLFNERCNRIISFLKRFESSLVRLSLVLLCILIIYYFYIAYPGITAAAYDYLDLSFDEAIQITVFNFVVSTPLIVLVLIFTFGVFYFIGCKIDFPYLFFVGCFLLIVLAVAVSGTIGTNPRFRSVDCRYLLPFLPTLLISISTGVFKTDSGADMLKKIRIIDVRRCVILLLIISMSYSNFIVSPYYIRYTNAVAPDGYLCRGTWGLGGYEAAEYLNDAYNNRNDLVVYDSRNGFKSFFRRGSTISWYKQFWEENPDYIVVYYERTHRYKTELDKYHTVTPEFKITLNGARLVGVYKYHPELHNTNHTMVNQIT